MRQNLIPQHRYILSCKFSGQDTKKVVAFHASVAMLEIQNSGSGKKVIWFSQQYQFHSLRNMHILSYMKHKKLESYSRPHRLSKTENPLKNRQWLVE